MARKFKPTFVPTIVSNIDLSFFGSGYFEQMCITVCMLCNITNFRILPDNSGELSVKATVVKAVISHPSHYSSSVHIMICR